MTKWTIRAVSDKGETQTAEIETDVDIASYALDKFESIHGWGCWTNIDIDKMESDNA